MVELQKSVKIRDKIWLLKKYKYLTPSEVLETAKQRLIGTTGYQAKDLY